MASDTKDPELQQFLADLYAIENISQDEIDLWYQTYSYKGFNRMAVIKDLIKKVSDIKIVQQIIMICGLMGPQRAASCKLLNGRIINSYGIPASGMKGTTGVSCQRITAATADLCAYLLKKTKLGKRLNLPCPAWLQFPSAGSIILPDELRQQHIEFSKRFSIAIGGSFNEQIYMQMVNNSYLDPKLNLFDGFTLTYISPIPASISSSASFGTGTAQPTISTPKPKDKSKP